MSDLSDLIALASFPQQVVVQPQRQGAASGIGQSLKPVAFGVGDADSEDDGSGFAGAGWSAGSHVDEINRPQKGLTTGPLTGHNTPMTSIRLLTRMFSTTPLGTAREGYICAEDGGTVWTVEGYTTGAQQMDQAGNFIRPTGHQVTNHASLRDATEYALRMGWNSAALSMWACDYELTPAAVNAG